MNVFLWILQILLALHAITGAIWKFSNSEAAASLNAIPHQLWMALSIIELLCSACLILPLLNKRLGILVPISALIIAGEMLFFCCVQIYSGESNNAQIIYWIVTASICVFLAYCRFKLKPIKP